MNMLAVRKFTVTSVAAACFAVSACSSDQVIDNTVGVAAGATKIVAKGAVGAGKLAVKGGKKIVGSDE